MPLRPRPCVMPDSHFYRYDDFDRALVAERVAQFRDQVAPPPRRRADRGRSSSRCGCRTASTCSSTPTCCGSPSPTARCRSRQLRKLAHIARNYDRGYGHFTTRQNLQFNWTAAEGRARHPRRAGRGRDARASRPRGNCIRNVTTDHFAGAAADEIVDPRPYAEILRQWSTLPSRSSRSCRASSRSR